MESQPPLDRADLFLKLILKYAFRLLPVVFVLFVAYSFTPNFVNQNRHSPANACIANLKQLDGGKKQWALENQAGATAAPEWHDLIGPDKYIKNTPICSSGGKYTLNAVKQVPTCSLGINVSPPHILPQ